MKLYLTLDNEKGNKIERVIQVDEDKEFFTTLNDIGNDMYESMCELEIKVDEEIPTEEGLQKYIDSIPAIDIAGDDEAMRKSGVAPSTDPY